MTREQTFTTRPRPEQTTPEKGGAELDLRHALDHVVEVLDDPPADLLVAAIGDGIGVRAGGVRPPASRVNSRPSMVIVAVAHRRRSRRRFGRGPRSPR